jgi:hypothetical protein
MEDENMNNTNLTEAVVQKREWVKPTFERQALNEALTGGNVSPDGVSSNLS